MDDNSNPNDPNVNNAPITPDTPLDQGSLPTAPATDFASASTVADQAPPVQPDLSTQNASLPPSPWETSQPTQQEPQTSPQESPIAPQTPQEQTQAGGMSDQLSGANFNAPPAQTTQPVSGESQGNLPAGSIPTDSQGIPHFASTEGAVSSYSPFQNNASLAQAPESQTEEAAPTDLSQLTANTNGQNHEQNNVYTPPVANTDTLVVSGNASEPTAITAEHKKSLPLIAIIGALFVSLIVAGASAYFILGIGQTPKQPASPAPVPAQTPEVQATPTPSPSDTQSVSEGSGDFGSLAGEPTDSEVFQNATSAADLIKQRQAQATTSGGSN